MNKIHTSCKDCIFATYQDKTQTGCQLGRLDRFREHGSEIIEAYDDDKEFLIVDGRICNAFRSRLGQWAIDHADDPLAQLTRELRLKMTAVVLLQGQINEEDIGRTALALKGQTIAPVETFFVNNQDGIKPGRVNAVIWSNLDNAVTWRMVGMLERNKDGSRVGPERCVDAAIDQSREGRWYCVFNAGFAPPANFIETIHKALNERMERFSLLLPRSDGNALVVQTAIHKHPMMGGNEPMMVSVDEKMQQYFSAPFETHPPRTLLRNLAEKVRFYALANDQPYMFRNVEDVVTCW